MNEIGMKALVVAVACTAILSAISGCASCRLDKRWTVRDVVSLLAACLSMVALTFVVVTSLGVLDWRNW